MTPLSPAAQAVLDAAQAAYWMFDAMCPADADAIAAAVLRAAADQVLPAPRRPFDSCCEIRTASERVELLAIAAELEAQQ